MPGPESSSELARGDTLDGRPDVGLDRTLAGQAFPAPRGGQASTLREGDNAARSATLDGSATPAISNEEAVGNTLDGSEISLRIARSAVTTFPVKNWDRYELLSLLGRGGMGAVYKARHRQLGRLVALKFIHTASPDTTARFIQEARAQARIEHPHICKVYEVGEVEGKSYIAMQLVRGPSLAQAAKDMSLTDKVTTIKKVAEAMHEAHRLGIIHRGPTLSKSPTAQGIKWRWGEFGGNSGRQGWLLGKSAQMRKP